VKMKFIPLILLGATFAVLGPSGGQQVQSPKEVIQQFVKADLAGMRLTPEGRSKMAQLLVRPSTATPDPIDIVSDKFEIHETPTTQGSVNLDLYFPYFYGWLDSALRFKAAPHMAPGNGLIREGINAEYKLVLTHKNAGPEPDKQETREAAGAQEWRIENAPSFATVSLATAIGHLTEMRDKSTDPGIKKNADQTLAKLKKLTAHAP